MSTALDRKDRCQLWPLVALVLTFFFLVGWEAVASSSRPAADESEGKEIGTPFPTTPDILSEYFVLKKDDLQDRYATCQKRSEELQKQLKKRRGVTSKQKKLLLEELKAAKHCLCELRRDGLEERIALMKKQLKDLEGQRQQVLCPLGSPEKEK